METTTTFLDIMPVIPTADIARDVAWYQDKIGFEQVFRNEWYAVLRRDAVYLHLQWHAGTEEDPLLGGSVIRIAVKHIQPIFQRLVKEGTLDPAKLTLNTPWGTNEFGLFDLNKNAIFIVEEVTP